MIICEYEFNRPDSKTPDYSMCEVDSYAWIPAGSDMPNHRLSLRKNLKTGEYEVYRHYYEQHLISRGPATVIVGKDTGQEEIAFKSKDLGEAIRFADGQYRKYHGDEEKADQVCQHKHPVRSSLCNAMQRGENHDL